MDRATVLVYEQKSAEWEARRTPRSLDRARAFGARVGAGPSADLGCGTGWYAPALAPPVVALDAAHAMVARAGALAPGALRVQGDLERLPLRRGALRGAWANNSYVHLPRTAVPMALAELHGALCVDAPVEIAVFGGDQEHGAVDDDDLGGRAFSLWDPPHLRDVFVGGGFELDDVAERRNDKGHEIVVRARRARTLADTVAPRLRMLVCGLNPSVYAADAGVGYARPTNRFWRAAATAGLVTRTYDAVHALRVDGVGITDLVKRATVGADELSADEFARGLARVERLCAWLEPRVVCFVGLVGWRAVVDRRAVPGVQPRRVGGRPAYVMPSTSGRNARVPLDALAAHFRAALALRA